MLEFQEYRQENPLQNSSLVETYGEEIGRPVFQYEEFAFTHTQALLPRYCHYLLPSIGEFCTNLFFYLCAGEFSSTGVGLQQNSECKAFLRDSSHYAKFVVKYS